MAGSRGPGFLASPQAHSVGGESRPVPIRSTMSPSRMTMMRRLRVLIWDSVEIPACESKQRVRPAGDVFRLRLHPTPAVVTKRAALSWCAPKLARVE